MYEIFAGKFSCWKIFEGSTSYENILTRKFYNIAFVIAYIARAGRKSTEKVIAMEVFRKLMLYSRLPRQRVVGVQKRARKRFRSIPCRCERGTIIGHLPRKASWVYGVCCFCDGEVATVECTVTGRRKYSAAWPGARRTWSPLLSTFQGNAYAPRRFRKPVAWPNVVSDRHYWTSYKVAWASNANTWNGAHYNLHRNVLNYLL